MEKEKNKFFLATRITQEEEKKLKERMEKLNIKKRSDYLRYCIRSEWDKKIEIKNNNDTDELAYQIRKIGVNINQIAKFINATGQLPDIQGQLNTLMKAVENINKTDEGQK